MSKFNLDEMDIETGIQCRRMDIERIISAKNEQSERGMASRTINIEKARIYAGGRGRRKNSEQMHGAIDKI